MPTTRTLLSATLLALACVAPAADNLIANGSFEDGKAPWWGEGSWEVAKDKPATGAAALRIGGGYVCQDKRVVQGGKRYLVSMPVRCEGAPEGSPLTTNARLKAALYVAGVQAVKLGVPAAAAAALGKK